MKHNPKAITTGMQLYFSGESLRNTMRSLKLLGVEVSHQTVYNRIKKYVRLMKKYAETLTPNVSDTWRADEIYIKIKRDLKYLFAMMDDETRFWIAQEVAETKTQRTQTVQTSQKTNEKTTKNLHYRWIANVLGICQKSLPKSKTHTQNRLRQNSTQQQ